MSSNVNALLAAVAKLSGADNYYDWACQMQLILMCSGCWGVVNGSVSKPCHTDLRCLKDWDAKSVDCYTAIGLMLNLDQTIHIHNCPDALSAWSALKQLYSQNLAANQISIKQQMQNTQLVPGDTVGDYLNTITTYANQLQSMGITVSDQDITDILLANLPPSYDSIATALIICHG
jgi:gag-polypeptide of LTR copia-type